MISHQKPMLCSRENEKFCGIQSRCRICESKKHGILIKRKMTHFFVPKNVSDWWNMIGFNQIQQDDNDKRGIEQRNWKWNGNGNENENGKGNENENETGWG